MTGDVSGDDPDQGAAVRRAEQRDLAGPDVLVARRGHLHRARQVHPQLEAVEQPAADDQFLRGSSMCRMPPPAVIHWVSPLVIRPPPPLE